MPEYDMVLRDKDGGSGLVLHRLSWQYKRKYWLEQAELRIAGWRLDKSFHSVPTDQIAMQVELVIFVFL